MARLLTLISPLGTNTSLQMKFELNLVTLRSASRWKHQISHRVTWRVEIVFEGLDVGQCKAKGVVRMGKLRPLVPVTFRPLAWLKAHQSEVSNDYSTSIKKFESLQVSTCTLLVFVDSVVCCNFATTGILFKGSPSAHRVERPLCL